MKKDATIMTKCDFCTKSSPDGKCSWVFQAFREDDCEKAIELMVKTLKNSNDKK